MACFALGIAGRDVVWELGLSPKYEGDYLSFAFLTCVTIAGLGLVTLIVTGGLRAFCKKLKNGRMLLNVAYYGVATGALYGAGAFLTSHDRMGAGLFNVVDYGITPVATAVMGWLLTRGEFPNGFWKSIAICLVGLVALLSAQDLSTGWAYVALAVALPFFTASQDGLSARLREPEGGGLSAPELLVLRFVPAAAVQAFFATVITKSGINVRIPEVTFPVTILCGFVPMFLLYVVLRRDELARLATWEFLIPVVAFFATLHARPENREPLPLLGALTILVGFALTHRLFRKRQPGAAAGPPIQESPSA